MSTTIDNRVVEMQFDNRHFEKNVATSMSTLDKLKKSLNLTGAAKGLEDVSASAKKVDLSGLSKGADTVGLRFNAMYTIADQALRNITNSAMAAGKKIVNALTLDPVKTGFQEYETQINAVQTILANTESKGTTIDQVNEALEQLNTYADKTIYNFTEMTRNIGTFTAAGVDLDTSVNAIQGIANLAAVSGSTSQQASTAMYQLSQALSSGTVKLMDWNSVVNAGMGGQVFQDALKETARVHGVAIDEMIEEQGSFRETLSEGWLTSEILTETLMKFTMATEGLTEAEIAANKEKLKGLGYTDEQIEGIFKLGNTATNAATKVKTFTQLWDVMKESAQSGWAQTWKLLIGDFEEAKNLLTPLADLFTGAINKMSEARNAVLESALAKNFRKAWEGISKSLGPVGDAFEKVDLAVSGVTKTLDEHKAVVNSVIRGDWGNYLDRYNKLTESGYDWKYVQNLVNEELGSSKRHTSEYTEAVDKLGKSQEGAASSTEKLTEAEAKHVAHLAKKTEGELRRIGYTKEQIAALKELASISEKIGVPVDELLLKMDEIDGRWLLIDSFKNAGQGIIAVVKAIGKAWSETFDGISGDDIFDVIAAMHRFSNKLVVSEETAGKLTRTLKGVFAILDIITTLTGGGLKIAFKLISGVLKYFNMDLLEATARIGDAVVSFRDWIDENFGVSAALDFLVPKIAYAAKAISGFVSKVKNSEAFKTFTEYLGDAAESAKEFFGSIDGSDVLNSITSKVSAAAKAISGFFAAIKNSKAFTSFSKYITETASRLKEFFGGIKGTEQFANLMNSLGNAGKVFSGIYESIKNSKDLPADIIAGLVNGLKNGVGPVVKAVFELAKSIIVGVCEVLGINSPSTVFMAIGGFLIAGLVLGLKNGSGDMMEAIKGIFDNILTFIQDLDFGAVFAGATMVGVLMAISKIANALEALTEPFEGFGDFMEDLGKSVKKVSGAISTNLKAKALQTIASSLLMLVGAVVVLTFVPAEKLWGAIGALLAIAAIVGALTIIIGKFGPSDIGELTKFAASLLGMAGALLILSISLKLLSGLSMDELGAAVVGMGSIVTSLILLMVFTSSIDKKIDGLGGTFIKLGLAMMLIVGVMKLAGGLNETELKQGSALIIGFGLLVAGFMWATNLLDKGDISAVGGMLLKISAAMLIMAGTVKILGNLTEDEIKQGGLVILAFVGIIVGLMAATRLLGKSEVTKIGSMFMGIAGAMLMMALVARILGGMDPTQLAVGIKAVFVLGLIITGLIWATKLATEKELKGIASTLLAMSVAIGVMALVATLLSFLKPERLAQGVGAVAAMAIMMALMIYVTKDAKDCKANLIVLTVAIGVMAAAIAALSFIPVDKLGNATLALSSVIAMFAILIHAAGQAEGSIGTLIVMTIAMGLLGGLLYVLSGLPVKGLLASAGALSALMLSMSAAMWIIGKSGEASKSALIAMGVLTGIMFVLGLVLRMLRGMTIEEAIASAGSLSVLIIAMVAAIKLLGTVDNVSNSAMGALVVMALVMAGLGMILQSMKGISWQSALTSVLSLSALLYAMVGAMTILKGVATISNSALISLGVMTVVMGVLGVIVVSMSGVPWQSALVSTISLAALLYAMVGALTIVSATGPLSNSALISIAAMTGVIIALAVVLYKMQEMPIESTITSALSLSVLLLAMAAACAIVSMIPSAAAIDGALGLAAFIGIMAAVVTAAGLLMKIPGFAELLADGGEALGLVGKAIGSFVGGIVGGVADGVMSVLPDLGQYLSDFMTNVTPFIEGVKNVDLDTLAGAGYLAAAIAALGVAEFIAGIASLVNFGGTFADLGSDLSQFMLNAQPFIAGASALNEDMLAGVRALAEVVLILSAANILEGLAKLFGGGESSLATFGAQLPELGANMSAFANNLGTFTDAQMTTVACAAGAIKALATAANEIPNEGGWAAKILGDNSLATFGSYLPDLGTNLASFVTNLGTFNEDQVTTIGCAADAIVKLSEAANQIPNEGGWAAKILGDNSIATFGSYLPALGTNLASFVTNLGTFTDAQVTTVESAANAIVKLSEAASKIPNEGGWAAKILGDNSIAKFGDQLPGLGTNLASFVTNLGTFSEDQVATVGAAGNAIAKLAEASKSIDGQADWAKKIFGDNSLSSFGEEIAKTGSSLAKFVENLGTFSEDQVTSVTQAVRAINAFAGLAGTDLKKAKDNMAGFGDKMVVLAEDIVTFTSKAGSAEKVSTAVSNVNKILGVIKDIAAANTSSMKTFADSLKKLGDDGVKKFVSAFTSDSAKKDVKDALAKLVAKAIEGIESKEKAFKTACEELVDAGLDKIKTKTNYTDWKGAGKYLVDGFAEGITAETFKAEAAATAMANAALEAAEEALDENSPSEEGVRIGKFFTMGVANGISDLADMVYDNSYDVASYAKEGLNRAISAISDFVNMDMDTQPTIRPVLDLTAVEAGAGRIGNLFDGQSVGVLAKVRGISSMMNQNRQNGVNDDVVHELKKLRGELGNVGGTQYNINGVTYDDGSNITDAVKTIVRAARIEGRV